VGKKGWEKGGRGGGRQKGERSKGGEGIEERDEGEGKDEGKGGKEGRGEEEIAWRRYSRARTSRLNCPRPAAPWVAALSALRCAALKQIRATDWRGKAWDWNERSHHRTVPLGVQLDAPRYARRDGCAGHRRRALSRSRLKVGWPESADRHRSESTELITQPT